MAGKTCVSVIESYPEHGRVFLVKIYQNIHAEDKISADTKLHEILNFYKDQTNTFVFDVPQTLPKCVECKLKCPGYESCSEPEIVWLRHWLHKKNKIKSPKKLITPYTQRCVDAYLSSELEVPFEVQHTLGANIAPLTARSLFVKRRLEIETFECNPKINVYRIGSYFKMPKTHIRFHKHAIGGDESRRYFLKILSEKAGIFFYQQDFKSMYESAQAFDSFICAFAGFLDSINQTSKKPMGFPASETWSLIPELTDDFPLK